MKGLKLQGTHLNLFESSLCFERKWLSWYNNTRRVCLSSQPYQIAQSSDGLKLEGGWGGGDIYICMEVGHICLSWAVLTCWPVCTVLRFFDFFFKDQKVWGKWHFWPLFESSGISLYFNGQQIICRRAVWENEKENKTKWWWQENTQYI